MSSVRERIAHLGDFTLGPRVLRMVAWAVPIGAAGALAAWALLRLIGLLTNLVFYQRINTRLVAPGGVHHQAYPPGRHPRFLGAGRLVGRRRWGDALAA